ncbi:MAG: hypothetical protein ACOYNI_02260 [Acidimicrobiia bacterium]
MAQIAQLSSADAAKTAESARKAGEILNAAQGNVANSVNNTGHAGLHHDASVQLSADLKRAAGYLREVLVMLSSQTIEFDGQSHQLVASGANGVANIPVTPGW